MKPLPEVITGDVIKYVKEHTKTPKNQENGGAMHVCAASVVGGTLGKPALDPLACAKVRFDGRCYENQGIFFSWCQVANKKRYIFKMFVYDFLKIGY